MLLPDYEELVNLKTQSKAVRMDSRQKVVSPAFGGHTSLFKGRGLDFSEYREYAAGDDVRSIDWRVTARTGRAHTKVFTEERERDVFLIVDMNRYMEFGTRNTFKSVQAARAAAIIAWRAHELHDKTGAILFGSIPESIKFLNPTRSRKSIWEMFRTITQARDHTPQVKIESALELAERRVPSGSTVFIISDFFEVSFEMETRLGSLSRRCEVTLVKVSDPADYSLPKVDEVHFSNEVGSEALIDTNDENANTIYQKIWKKNDTALGSIADRFRSKLIHISTDRDVVVDLLRNHPFREERSAPDENES